MKMATKSFVLSCSAFLLCSCLVNPASLEKVLEEKYINLPNGFEKKFEYIGKCTQKSRFSLAPGVYKAEYYGRNGVFYRGPAMAVTQAGSSDCSETPQSATIKFDGGIFVSNNKKTEPIMYIYENHISRQTNLEIDGNSIAKTVTPANSAYVNAVGGAIGGSVVAAIISNENGKIRFYGGQLSENLRAAIEMSD